MSIYRVLRSRIADSSNPIKLVANEEVTCIEESDANGDWPNWTLCRNASKEGWVPTQIIKRDGIDGVILEDYDATEFSIEIGEIYISNKTLNGWIWGYREGCPNQLAWVPLNYIELIE